MWRTGIPPFSLVYLSDQLERVGWLVSAVHFPWDSQSQAAEIYKNCRSVQVKRIKPNHLLHTRPHIGLDGRRSAKLERIPLSAMVMHRAISISSGRRIEEHMWKQVHRWRDRAPYYPIFQATRALQVAIRIGTRLRTAGGRLRTGKFELLIIKIRN